MKLLQVVLCVVLALLGRCVTQDAQDFQVPMTQNEQYQMMTQYRTGKLNFRKTIYPASDFNADVDAKALFVAMEGSDINKTAISNIITARSMEQKKDISKAYARLYSRSLIHDLDSKLSGDYWKVILALMSPLPTYYVSEMRAHLTGRYPDKDDIVEILLSLSNDGIRYLSTHYYFRFKNEIVTDVKTHLGLSGRIHTLIQGLLKVERPETTYVDMSQVETDVKEVINNNWSDVTDIISILTSRSFPHLRKMFEAYEKKTGKDIEEAFDLREEGDFKSGVLAIVRRAKSSVGYFAHQLHEMIGRNSLIRIIVGRSEIDLRGVLNVYAKKYGRPLYNDLTIRMKKNDKDFREVLTAIVGKF